MSDFTFNIADYRPLSAARAPNAHDMGHLARRPSGFIVLSSNSEPREYDAPWMNSRHAIVEIPPMRGPHGGDRLSFHASSYPRRGKILRFTNEVHERVYVMPSNTGAQEEDDPDPEAA